MSMNWNAEEIAAVAPIVAGFDADPGARDIGARNATLLLSPSASSSLTGALTGDCPGPRSLLIRSLCAQLGFDEGRLTALNLEHKLVQALVLRAYCGDAIPATRAIPRELYGITVAEAKSYLDAAYPAGAVFIKRARGYGSAERKEADARGEFLQTLGVTAPFAATTHAPALHDEVYVVQQRIDIVMEFRVHTIEGAVVPDLTFRRHRTGIAPGERALANDYVQRLLDRLPNGLVRGALLAWDVATTPEGRFVVIEVNIAGYHRVFEPGFHCSGFFLGPWGAPATAKLLAFVEGQYGVTIQVANDSEASVETADAFWRVARWQELFRLGSNIDALVQRASSCGAASTREEALMAEQRAFDALLARLGSISTNLKALA